MIPIDKATAARIAEHLRASGMALDVRVMGGEDQLAMEIQAATETRRDPGLYFIREESGAIRLKNLSYDSVGQPVWDSERSNVQTDKPYGKIIAGPYDVQDLWGWVTNNWCQSEIDEALKGE